MRTILLFAFCFLASQAFSQGERHLSLELLGSGGIASLNYEQSILQKEPLDLKFRVGVSFAPIDRNNGTALAFPLMLHAVVGQSPHRLDVGAGQTFSLTTKGSFFLRMPLSAGYRFQPEGKRYYLRLAYTPILSYLIDFQWQHWGGFTIGYQIKGKS